MNKIVLNQLSDRLCKAGGALGFYKLIVRSTGHISDIYVINNHALQLEIDWHENNLFMYIVYLKNNALPDEHVVYRYPDGHWCRKYLEEIYNTKRPVTKDLDRRYSSAYLFDCFEFYMQLINRDTMVLKDFGDNGTLLLSPPKPTK